MEVLTPKRGEVWWINFDPSTGSESKKIRPAVIVSNDYSNRHVSRFQIIPTTSNISRVYPSDCIVTIQNQSSKAMANQLTTVDVSRVMKKIAVVSNFDMELIEQVIKVQLGLEGR